MAVSVAHQSLQLFFLLLLFVYCPGRLFLRAIRYSASAFETFTLSLTGGIALLIGAYWLLCASHAAAGLPLFGLACGAGELACRLRRPRNGDDLPRHALPAPGWPFYLMTAAAILMHGLLMFPSGVNSPHGFLLYNTHAADASNHVYIMQEFARTFPASSPGFSGHPLENYHFFFTLFWGALLRLAPLNAWDCYFRFTPALFSLLLCAAAYLAGAGWTGSRKAGWAATALTALCSSFGVLFALGSRYGLPTFWDGNLWLQSPAFLVLNPPAFLSFAFLLAGWRTLHGWTQNKDKAMLAATVLLWGALPGIKMYAALLVAAGLAAGGAWEALFQRRFRLWTAGLALAPLYLFQYLALSSGAASILIFFPGFNLAAMLFLPGMIGVMTSSQLAELYRAHPAGAVLLIGALIPVFALGNLGLRLIGLPRVWRDFTRPRTGDPLMFFLLAAAGAGLTLPVLFIQAGAGQWNTIQFYFFVVLLSSLPAASTLADWLDRLPPGRQAGLWAAVLAIGAAPLLHDLWRSEKVTNVYAVAPPLTAACQWIRDQTPPGGVVLTPLPGSLARNGFHSWESLKARALLRTREDWLKVAVERPEAQEEPAAPDPVVRSGRLTITTLDRPNTAFVAAFTGHPSYLEQPLVVLQRSPGAKLDERFQEVLRFYAQPASAESLAFLARAGIAWVIMPADGPDLPPPAVARFASGGVRVFDVRPTPSEP